MCTAGGSSREALRPIVTLSDTSPRGRAPERLCRTIDLLPSIRFLQPLMMRWRLTAGWTIAEYAGLPLRETLPEEIWRSYLPRASPPMRCAPRPFWLERRHCRPSLMTLSGATYETRADADPYFTRQQVAELVRSYLGSADANDPLASPLQGRLSGLAPIRIHVGEDEVLLDDSRRYVERAIAAGVDARLDVWTGMPHGFVASVGTLKASAQALNAIGMFLTEQLRAGIANNHFSRRK